MRSCEANALSSRTVHSVFSEPMPYQAMGEDSSQLEMAKSNR